MGHPLKKQLSSAFAFFCLFAIGCLPATNLTPLRLKSEPVVQAYTDFSFQAGGYRTFSVIPGSLLSDSTYLGKGILEQQMLFALRCALEERGYIYVAPNQSPDLWFTMDGNAPYYQTYVPPSTISFPVFVPKQTSVTYGNKSGSFDVSSGAGYVWGTYNGSSVSRTTTPAHFETGTYTSSGEYVGYFYPGLCVFGFDAKTLKPVWSGNAMGVSQKQDIRISSQLVLRQLLKQLPASAVGDTAVRRFLDACGFDYAIFTADGNNYFPAVTSLEYSLPAYDGGLREKDLIIEIGGITTLNKPKSEVDEMLKNRRDGRFMIKVQRMDEELLVRIVQQ
jgi:hypothetical protein